jgi:hypothetical protein
LIYLKLIPILISLLSGTPDPSKIVSVLIGAASQENHDDGVERIIGTPYKNGLDYLQYYSAAHFPEDRRNYAGIALQNFTSAHNIEKDYLRIARAEIYISSVFRLLGDHAQTIHWAEEAYKELSLAEALAWRINEAFSDDVTLIPQNSLSSIGLGPLCVASRTAEIQAFRHCYERGSNPSILNWPWNKAAKIRGVKLKEIYAYKEPLSRFLKMAGSQIGELKHPVAIALDDFEHGADAAARLSDEKCVGGRDPNPISSYNLCY